MCYIRFWVSCQFSSCCCCSATYVREFLGRTFSKSSPATTFSQVFSRFVVVWYIAVFYPSVPNTPFYASMIIAWSISEITRYVHYVLLILKTKSSLVEWARYSLFYVLYPIGAGSEWVLIFKSLPLAKERFGIVGYIVNVVFLVIWPPSLAFLMSHLHRQRRRHVKGKGKAAETSKKEL
ncbi:protein-tyrosine phosphatase-like protein [Atractiella rhizophila]|nr:protein-tyrosine phosphatase-like protein [Atractiella rhizophila]